MFSTVVVHNWPLNWKDSRMNLRSSRSRRLSFVELVGAVLLHPAGAHLRLADFAGPPKHPLLKKKTAVLGPHHLHCIVVSQGPRKNRVED